MENFPVTQLPSPPLLAKKDMKRIGLVLLETDLTSERDFARLISAGPAGDIVGLHCNRIPFANPTSPENLRAMAPDLGRVAAGIVPDQALDVVYFSCTSASVAIGDDEVARAINTGKPDAKIVTPAMAARAAFKALGVRKISLLTPYLLETALPMARYFETNGLEVANLCYFNMADDREMARVRKDAILQAAREAIHKDAQGLFISCTALPAAECVAELEQELGLPVVTSNLAGAWLTLRKAGLDHEAPEFGRLFSLPAPATV